MLAAEAERARQQEEVRALQARLQHGHQASLAEVQQLQARLRQLEPQPDKLKKLQDENEQLKQQAAFVAAYRLSYRTAVLVWRF